MFQINNVKDFRLIKEKYPEKYNINKQDHLGNTILHKAVISGNHDLVIEIFHSFFVDLEARAKDEGTKKAGGKKNG